MKITCPHCSQRLDLDAVTLESLHDSRVFECPACGGSVSLADSPGDHARTPSPSPGGWVAPDAEVLSQSFDSRYRIIRLLGRGGMGAVYEGLDSRLDRRVAIKILPMETGRGMDALARFEREAKAMAALDHPNIVHIHDYGSTADGQPYFVMEFIDGMDLHGLRHSGNLDLPGALEIISQVCSALHYAHGRGIVHRDIKPANIMVTREGVAKVADFGLAKVLGTETNPQYDPTLTRSGAAMGTPDYMAPEQLEGNPVDHRADIYSLGVMLYALLTGSPPRGAWPPPSQRVEIDIRLDEIVIRALQQNPSARYQAASEVKGDIDSVKSSTGGGPLPPGVDPAPLPSSRPAIPATHQTSSAPGHAKSKSQPVRTRIPDAEILSTTRSLNTTMLVLGTLAILIIGGLAAYLANRKTGDTYHTEQTITTSVTNNTYFTQLIASGATTAKDLEAVTDIRPYGEGFVGISKEPMDWNGAQDLANRTGSSVLTLDRPIKGITGELSAWLAESFASHLATSVWVTVGSSPHYFENSHAVEAVNLTIPRKAMLHWETPRPETEPGTAAPQNDPATEDQPPSAEQTVPPPEETQPDPKATDLTPSVKETIDLLALADPDKDRIAVINGESHSRGNNWKRVNGAMIYTSDGGSGKIASPVAIDSRSYEMEVDYERLSGNGRLHVDIPYKATKQGMTLIPIYLDAPGFQMVCMKTGGKWPAARQSSGRAVIRLNSDLGGNFGQITVTLDGETLVNWKGDLTSVTYSINETHPGFPGQPVPSLYAHTDSYKINAWILRIYEGGAKLLRQAPPNRIGPLPWTNTDGKVIQAEFVRLGGESVVIRKDGKEFSIPFFKLTHSSMEQARRLAGNEQLAERRAEAKPILSESLRDGLVLHFSFDRDESGSLVSDSSDLKNHGKSSGIRWTPDGRRGGAYEFAKDGDEIEVTNSPSLNPVRLTLSAWVKTSHTDHYWRRVFDKSYSTGFALSVIGDFKQTRWHGMVGLELGPGPKTQFCRTNLNVADGQWHHLVATFDGIEQRLFVDGKPDGIPLIRAKSEQLQATVFNLVIGCNRSNLSTDEDDLGKSFRGFIDEPMIWSRALSPEEVSKLFQSFPPAK